MKDFIREGDAATVEAHPLSLELVSRLMRLDSAAFGRAVCRLLTAMGYERPRTLAHAGLGGRNKDGGADIEVYARTGVTVIKVLVQAKQYSEPVPARYVDTLRGALARSGGGAGLIISTGGFSTVAVEAAETPGLPPVRLVDGSAFVRLMIRHGLGVQGGLIVDEAYFARLAGAS